MAEGSPIEDPVSPEMNSYDTFVEAVGTAVAVFDGGVLKFGGFSVNNANADMSYQPLFPGKNFTYSINNAGDYENIQLLGVSKDISKWIDAVNTNADPFIDLSDILQNRLFGRVYEDYESNLSDQLSIVDNDTFGDNAVNQDNRPKSDNGKTYFNWDIEFSQEPEKLSSMSLVFFNAKSVGKNPYCVCQFSDIMGRGEISVSYDSEENDSEVTISGTHGKFSLAGTQLQDQNNRTDSNRLDNISCVTVSCLSGESKLNVKMFLEHPEIPTFIEEGTLRVVVFDDKNIEQFKYYHLLDAYGVVNAYQVYTNRELYGSELTGTGWKIVYGKTQISDSDADRMKSAIEIDGVGRVFLKDIDLSKYSFLSDVYIFNQNKVAFKYNEEDMFPFSDEEYFYPFLNRKFPKTAAQYYADHLKFTVGDSKMFDQGKTIFDNRNVFFIDTNETENVLSSLGTVSVPVAKNVISNELTVLAYEDFLGTTEITLSDGSGAVSVQNQQLYSPDDPHILRFVKFFGTDISGDGISVDESGLSAVTVNDYLLSNQTISVLSVFGQDDDIGSEFQSAVDVDIASTSADIGEFLKIQANYKKNPDGGITLFFNYENYINSPFVKIKNGRVYTDVVDGTYLRLESGETGVLDIVIQVRFYNGGKLFGYRNVKVLSYEITNLSDDKPKFMIRRIFTAEKDSALTAGVSTGGVLRVSDTEVEMTAEDFNRKKEI